MNPLDQLHEYLDRVRRRMLASALLRGAAIAALCALVATITLVLIANYFAFSDTSIAWSRILLFLIIAFAVAFGIIAPVLAVNQRRAARKVEEENAALNQRLVTCIESESSPLLNLLARDTLQTAQSIEPSQVIPSTKILGFSGTAAVAAGILGWLILAGPGYMGHGASLLWGATPKVGETFYDIQVTPGDQTIRRRSDQLITANLVGFRTGKATLKARYGAATKWEEVQMLPSQNGMGFEFLLSSVPEDVEYYVESGQVRSPQFRLNVVDLPSVKRIHVTYNYPKWTGLKPAVEDPGGDLRALEGTEADLLIETDKPLTNGSLVLDNGNTITLKQQENPNLSVARVTIQKDGTYHLVSTEQSRQVRVTDDYFIEAQEEREPTIKLSRPGRDLKVSPIEEVTLEASADDDFGLSEVTLHYSVNGGEEKKINLLQQRGSKSATERKTISLEEFKLIPGDIISVYATAKDARTTTQTDIYFLEAQPFEREYSQSQQSGGGMPGEGGEDGQDQIAQRQKEIIAATWNGIRDKSGNKKRAQEDAQFLNEIQTKLQMQALSLAQRMKARKVGGATDAFAAFAKDMEAAAKAMGPAAENLKDLKWKDALPHEQQALQHLLRAEARFREIQVAYGQQGGGGGGNSGGRDLESLFDLELDTEKNQYETSQQQASRSGNQQQDIDEALKKLEQLSRRQQELAQQQNQNNRQTPERRWQQEQLLKEAEELQKQLQQLSGNQQQQGSQQSQQGQQSQGQSGQSQSASSQSGQTGQQSGQSGQQQQQAQKKMSAEQRMAQMRMNQNSRSQQQVDPRIQKALDQLAQATEDMRRANQGGQQNSAETRRAAERLSDAKDLLGGMRREQGSSQLNDLARRAESLAQEQRQFAEQLRNRFGQGQTRAQQEQLMRQQTRQQNEQLSQEKTRLMEEYERLEKDIQSAIRNNPGQRATSSKLRQALGEAQAEEVGMRMKYMTEWLRRGLGPLAWVREAPVTNALDKLSEQVKEAAQAGQGNGPQGEGMERALSQLEELRRQLDQASRGGDQSGNQAGSQNGQQAGGQQPGQQGQLGQGQSGQQQAQGGQQGQQGQGGQQGQQGMQGQQGQEGQRGGGGDRQSPGYSSMNSGNQPNVQGSAPQGRNQVNTGQMQRAFSDGLRDLREMRRELSDSPESRQEVERVIREMQGIDPSRFPGNPQLVDKMRAQVLPALEQLELQLRRELDASEPGVARTGTSDKVPQGYSNAVAEYFRKLSKGK